MTGDGASPWEIGRVATATAPVRVADVGGWTDTWFGAPGRVCAVAVGPGVRVRAEVVADPVVDAHGDGRPVRILAPDVGVDLRCGPSAGPDGWARPEPLDQPLLEHAVGLVLGSVEPLPAGVGLVVTISSAVPPGASLGPSASVLVAVLAALDALVADGPAGRRSAADLARVAHEVEVGRAGREAGVQDHWAAALGGCSLLAISPYPDVRATPIPLAPATVDGLAERLVTVVFEAHDSSAVHAEVIRSVVGCTGPDHDRTRGALRRLSALAGDAADALAAGDLARWGAVLVAATGAQAELHPSLVGPAHAAGIDVARSLGAAGWKVNGAGGDGGSLTVLAADRAGAAAELAGALVTVHPAAQVVDLRPAGGVAVTVVAAS